MKYAPLALTHMVAIADLWKDVGGQRKIELGALEPLLWRDGRSRLPDAIRALREQGYAVTITTNGQLLTQFADELHSAGVALVRTSWHTTDPIVFREISGGYGTYKTFFQGISHTAALGTPMCFNKVLLKGHVGDLSRQLDFVETYGCRLKLYTLMWTPNIDDTFVRMYQDWRPIVREYVLHRTRSITRVEKQVGRKRIRFNLKHGGSVEVKMGDAMNRGQEPCVSCPHAGVCEEGFGDYVRVDPRLQLYFCYMRRDLGFPIKPYFGRPDAFRARLNEAVGAACNVSRLFSGAALRFTVTPYCNFNCRMPGEPTGWCMEAPGDYAYPRIRPSLLPVK